MEINKPTSIIILCILTLVFVVLFAIPEYQQSALLQTTLKSKQAEYSGKSAYFAKVATLVTQIDARKDQLAKIDSALPPSFSYAPVVNFFQTASAKSGLTIRSVQFSQAKVNTAVPGKEVKKVLITLDIVSTYQNFKTFLALVENSARLFKVNSISFNSMTSLGVTSLKNPQDILAFRVELETYTH